MKILSNLEKKKLLRNSRNSERMKKIETYVSLDKKQFSFLCVCMLAMRRAFDLIILCRMMSFKILLVVSGMCFITLP